MKSEKKISIVITSYNQKRFLGEAIESALNQTYKPYEIIVADDYSTDGSREMINKYAKKYPRLIKPIFNEKNLGIARNRNLGFKKVTGELVTWINGDDILLRRKLELELKTYLNNPNARWIYSQVFYTDLQRRRIGIRFEGKYRMKPYTFREVATRIGREPAYQLIDCCILDKTGLFDEELELYEDWDFTIRLAKSYEFAYCPIPLSEYRRHVGGISNIGKEVHLRALKRIYHKLVFLLQDMPENERRLIKKMFSSEIYRVEALRELEKNERIRAIKYTMKATRSNPKKVSLCKLYVKICLPKGLFNLMRQRVLKFRSIKRKYISNI